MTPRQIIDAYLAEARRVNGDARTDMVRLTYSPFGGWFYFRSPWKTGPNRWTVGGRANCYRRADIERMTAALRERDDFKPACTPVQLVPGTKDQ